MTTHSILVISREQNLADSRADVLEKAGYSVVSAGDLPTIQDACRQTTFDLVIIGYSLPFAEQRRVWQAVKEFCGTPMLQLFENGRHELLETQRIFTPDDATPDDFLSAVNLLLRPKRHRRHKPGQRKFG
jgi:CheY-like chemotaxis protein